MNKWLLICYIKIGEWEQALVINKYMENVPFHIGSKGKSVKGVAKPLEDTLENGIPRAFMIHIDGNFVGNLKCDKDGWEMDSSVDPELVEGLGTYIHAWYE